MFDLSLLCGDFLSSRFVKEFLPRLCTFMKAQASVSLKSTRIVKSDSSLGGNEPSNIGDSTYIYSHAFKLQCSILANIDKICILLDIKELELEDLISDVILTHLDKRQPKKLQQLAVSSLRNCALIDANIVWLCLHYTLPSNSIAGSDSDQAKPPPFIKTKFTSMQFNQDVLIDLTDIFNTIKYLS